jgi:hypothetical protein
MRRKLLLYILIVTLNFALSFAASAQDRMPAEFATGKALYQANKYEEALPHFYKALDKAYAVVPKDSLAIANERTIVNHIDNCYRDAEKQNLPFKNIDFDTTEKDSYSFLVSKVSSLTEDSVIITINEGTQSGIIPGKECYLWGSPNTSKDTGRQYKYLGAGKFIELTDFSAKVLVKFYSKRKGSQVYVKDFLEVSTHPVRNVKKSMYYDFAVWGLGFNDNNNSEILCKRAIYQNTDTLLADVLTDLYTFEVNDFSSTLNDLDDASFSVPYKEGRFKGYSLKQSFPMTNNYDLLNFFTFVKSFPGKYIGKNWKVNETYATWVLNFTPQGANSRQWLIPAIEATEMSELDALLKKTAYYIANDTLIAWSSRLYNYPNDKNMDAGRLLCEKLLYIAKYQRDTPAIADYYHRLAYIKSSQSYKKEALNDALKARALFKDNDTYIYTVANMYGTNEQFDSCFALYDQLLKKYPDNYEMKGNLGWYKTLAGAFAEAGPLCKAGYEGNPYSYSTTINYGHTFLLTGNVDSAKHYYSKMLENLKNPDDYLQGPKKDFEIFFSKGWQRANVSAIAEWLDNEYNKKYKTLTTASVLWSEAKKHYDNAKDHFSVKEYESAIAKWKVYLQLLEPFKDIRMVELHNTNAWIGIAYSKLKRNDSTLKYYKLAADMSTANFVNKRDKNPEDDLITDDYLRLFNFYDGNPKETKNAFTYKTLYDAEVQRLNDMFSQAKLYVMCIGGKDSANETTYEADAKLFFDNVSALGNKNEKSTNSIYISGAELTKQSVIKKLEEIRKQTKPEDIFIFYYAGITTNDSSKEKEALYLNPKDPQNGKIELKELLQDIDLIYAKKKIIITSEPNAALLARIAEEYTTQGSSSNEMIFICPGVRTPVNNGRSLFTTELVNAITELKKNSRFSAKEFVDKASYFLGRGKHYFPATSFTYGKDFVIYANDSVKNNIVSSKVEKRGLEIDTEEGSGGQPGGSLEHTNYALFFADDQYDEKNTWHQLSNPISDATALAALLSDDYGFKVEVVKNATKKEIENKLREYRSKNFSPNDQLMIFFAGHGIYFPDANMGYLVAKDSKDPRTADPNYNTYLSYSDLGNIYLKNLKCRRIFLVLDACYAGSFFEQKSFVRGGPDMRANDEDMKERMNRLKKNASGKSFYKGISSGGKETVEDGKKDEHSPFAASLIYMLNNAIQSHYITADAIIGEMQTSHPGNTMPSSGTFNYSDPQGLFIFEVKHGEQKQAGKTYNLK